MDKPQARTEGRQSVPRKVRQGRLAKDAVTRTLLYLDQRVSALEFELWHTGALQRLYYLRQLGFSDRVFPDAVHNRFNHVLGTCQRAEDILVAAAEQTRPGNVPGLAKLLGATERPDLLRAHIESRIDTARLMALLHDLAHIPFGHTLEDELHLFATKHDARTRQVKMLNRVTSQFLWGLYDDVFGCWPERWSAELAADQLVQQATRFAAELLEASKSDPHPAQLTGLDQFLVNLLAAQVALVTMHHGHDDATKGLMLPKLVDKVGIAAEEFDVRRDYFLIDAIGNTICADLLDYSRRDMRMANMVGDYDDRLFRWFVLSELKAPENDQPPAVRLAIKVFSSKFKPDVVREILKVLEIRYDLSERILFHPAKCCAGAMLGRVVEELGLSDSLDEMLVMGDECFLNWIDTQLASAVGMITSLRSSSPDEQVLLHHRALADEVAKSLATRLSIGSAADVTAWRRASPEVLARVEADLRAAAAVSDRLRSRHYYQLVYEATAHSDDAANREISKRFMQRGEREDLVRAVEKQCCLPAGTVLVHCPRRETNFKEADVLVLHSPDHPPVALSAARNVPQLTRMADRARTLADDYMTIWRLRVFLHKAYRHQAPSVIGLVREKVGAPNSPYLEATLRQDTNHALVTDFLERHGGDDGRRMIADARTELVAARKGTGGVRVSFEECLKRQELRRGPG